MSLVALCATLAISALAELVAAVLKRNDKRGNIPFGSFIAVGTYITFLFGSEITKYFDTIAKGCI
jgi:leader peptidase (prepilin peptidase)/N-methyltransferase